MRTVIFFIVVFGTSLTYVHCKPAHSFSTRLLPNDIIRVKKRQDDSSAGYLEQCGIVTFPKAQPGVVNVLAFLDSSWPYSHRQAIMLKMLNERLQRSGLPDTLFFVVNVDPSFAQTMDNAEDDIEREAWLGVSPEEIETFANIVKTTDSLAMSMTSQIQLIQDNEDLEIWKSLRGSRDQVLVIDRCGKLTYQVIVPWSILHFPYVKAAILSTYKDEPCGPCDVIPNTRDPLKYRDEETPQSGIPSSDGFNSTVEEYLQNVRDVHVPDVPESDLRNVLEFSTTDTSESESTTAQLVSEAIDDINETTTEFDIFDNSDNYTPMNFGAGTANELTTLESTTFMTTDDITKIEATTISSIFADSETTDFTNTVTSQPINDDQITNYQLKEKSPILQNSGDDVDVEEKLTTSSTDIINTDTTDSKYPVPYYDTTENLYTKDDVEDTTVPETPESNTPNFSTTPEKMMNFDNNSTESSAEKEDTTISIDSNQLDSPADNIYIKDQSEDTTEPETPESNASKFSTTPKKSINFVNDNSTDSSVEKEDTSSINNNSNQLDSLANNIYIKDQSEVTTEPETPESNTSKFSTTPKKSMYFDNDNSTESSVEKEDTTISIDANQLDSLADNMYIKDQFEDTTAHETLESNTSRFFRIHEKSTDFYNESSTLSSVEKEDSTISINSDTIQLDAVALTSNPEELATSENIMFDGSTEETVTLNRPSSVRNEEESNENTNPESLRDRFDDNSENEDTSQLSDMPLRIIMHAPHFHVDGDSTRMHEYLVLKTGSSDYHRHLASYDATRLYRGPQDFHENPEYHRNDEIESKMWPMKNVIYNKDESPGLYGEVADYWKNAGGQDNYDYTEETETSGTEQNTEQPSPDERISMKPSTPQNASLTGDEGIIEGVSTLPDDGEDKIPERLQADFANESVTDKQIWSEEILNAEEEEKRSKLIAHYSKLLPWIYYVLDK